MTVHQFLTLSSVVENESLFKKDRPKIAGVFINRLNKNMPLQSDITVLYALQEKRVAVTNKDLQVDSKYNTYKNTGLPVGPVLARRVLRTPWMTFSTTRRAIIITSSPRRMGP